LIAQIYNQADANPFETGRKYARENGAGIAGSVLLHALGAILILFVLTKSGTPIPQTVSRFLPVEVVQLGAETASPQEQQKTTIPQQRAAHTPVSQSASPNPPVRVAPRKEAPVADPLEAKLRGLAKLRQPDAPLHALDNSEVSNTDSTSNDAVPGNETTYSIRDYIRAQVERRWSLNLAALGNRDFKILIHVEMRRNGTVTKAEIVDQSRFRTDTAFHEIALSARNAVLLSSPFVLPNGNFSGDMDVILALTPRDTLR
jgi:hypothetical protein